MSFVCSNYSLAISVSSSCTNFSRGNAHGIATNLPVSVSTITLPGVHLMPNNDCHSFICSWTLPVYFPLSRHVVKFAALIPSFPASSIIASLLMLGRLNMLPIRS